MGCYASRLTSSSSFSSNPRKDGIENRSHSITIATENFPDTQPLLDQESNHHLIYPDVIHSPSSPNLNEIIEQQRLEITRLQQELETLKVSLSVSARATETLLVKAKQEFDLIFSKKVIEEIESGLNVLSTAVSFSNIGDLNADTGSGGSQTDDNTAHSDSDNASPLHSNKNSESFRDNCNRSDAETSSKDSDDGDTALLSIKSNKAGFQEIEESSLLKRYNFLKTVGEGSFGRVFLAKSTETSKICAVKGMLKNEDKIYTAECKNELSVLSTMKHEFVANLIEAFATEKHYFIAMEYYGGGDLYSITDAKTGRLGDAVRFYMAEVVVGLDYIHQQGYVFRDLKPENVTIDLHGHAKIVDFGFAIKCDDSKRAKGYGGTISYMAPEVMNGIDQYFFVADYWSLGVMIFCLISGELPFDSDEDADFLAEIDNKDIKYDPTVFSAECQELCEGLIETDPLYRFGSAGVGGVDSVKSHDFFKGVDWFNYKNWSPPTECVPALKTEEDTSRFTDKFTALAVKFEEIPNPFAF